MFTHSNSSNNPEQIFCCKDFTFLCFFVSLKFPFLAKNTELDDFFYYIFVIFNSILNYYVLSNYLGLNDIVLNLHPILQTSLDIRLKIVYSFIHC